MPKKIHATINGIDITVPEGTSILDAAREVQIKIPTLCKHPDLLPTASCGLCIVRIKGSPKMVRACCTPLEEGMDIVTHDPEIVAVRRTVLELILSNHPNECLTCGRNNNCELQRLAAEFGIRDEEFPKYLKQIPEDKSTPSIELHPQKCILCGRCVEVCQDIQDVWALCFLKRGIGTYISPAGLSINLNDSPCVKCGQCSAHCPTGAIFEKDETAKVWRALEDSDKYCVVQIAPAVRVAIGEAFGYPIGTNLTGKIYAALRRLGFEAVFDTNFGADLTIMEEGSEFVKKFKEGKGLPLITTCCPSWVDFMEKFYHDMIDHFSSAKSPHEMVGVLSKTYYAEKNGIDPSKIFMVSIMPCTSKKYEITRSDEMFASGYQDIDAVLTTRELARMIKQAGIDFVNLKEEEPDHILGDYTGAATIFGVTGGVMEAALRTAAYLITGKNLPKVDFEEVRGLQGIREAQIEIEGKKVNIAVANGLSNVEYILNKVRAAKEKGEPMPYDFIEVMACPGGCVGGGGQPYGVTDEIRAARAKGLYSEDEAATIRCSHDNPYIQQLYKEYLGQPLSEKSEKLLHTEYKPRPIYNK